MKQRVWGQGVCGGFRWAAIALGVWLMTGAAVWAADWAVDKATLCWEVEVTQSPSEPGAGVVLILPDGGILPRPAPDPVVMAGGRELKSEILWFDPNQGLGVIFEPPPDDRAQVYLRAAPSVRAPPAKSAFTASLLLFTKNTPSASLEQAFQVPKGVPGLDFRMGQVPFIGQRMNLYGADDHFISYYTGWIRQDKSQRTYFCTISDEGSELRIDGRTVASWPGLHKRDGGIRGEYGGWVEVSPGLHQIEYFHFEKSGEQEAHALWTTKPISKEHKPATIPASAFIRSGLARPRGVTARDGRPVAAFQSECKNYFWFDEKPINLFRLEPLFPDALPRDTVFAWTLAGEGPITNRAFNWLVVGSDPIQVSLTVSTKAAGGSRASRSAMIWTTPPGAGAKATPAGASVDNELHRQVYRDTLLAMCRTVPADRDPTAAWPADFWTLLINVVEPFKGGSILLELFERSRKRIQALKTDDREFLEDLFFETIRYARPADTIKWVERLEQEAKERERKFYWKLAKVDFYLNTLTNAAEARKQVNILRASAVSPAEIQVAMIRQGDMERLAGNYPEAIHFYSLAQDKYQSMAKVGPAAGGAGAVKPIGMARNKAELEARRRQLSSPSAGSSSRIVAPPPTQKWKTFAVHEASFLVTARDLIRDGFLLEARDVLNEWEVQFPMSKMKGDFPLAEAEFYVAAGIYHRALHILRMSRLGTDISSFLPATYALELECLQKLGQDAEAKELARKVAKEFPNHECGSLARRILDDR